MLPVGWLIGGEISQFTGLNLVEAVEIAVIIGIGIAGISLIVTAFKSNKESKISSAHLILSLLEPWRKDEFKNALADMHHGKHNPHKVEELLNQLEDIATFWKDHTLDDTHVKEFFGENLKFVRDDKFIQDYMKKWVDKNPDYYFVNLRKLIKKIDEWKI